MLELCMSGYFCKILRRSSLAQTINAFIGRLMCSFFSSFTGSLKQKTFYGCDLGRIFTWRCVVHQLLALCDGSNDLDVESTGSTNDPLNLAFLVNRENVHQKDLTVLMVVYFVRQSQMSLAMKWWLERNLLKIEESQHVFQQLNRVIWAWLRPYLKSR